MNLELKDIPGRIYLRYGLLMIPGTLVLVLILIVILQWISIPSWLFWSIIGAWLAKDIIMFPYVWRAHDMSRPGISRSMIGECGIVKKRLDPSGYIQIGGELWRAESVEAGLPIEIGQVVKVIKMEGLKLYVRFENSGN
ncbi:MAG: NfeD family protein [Desulfobacteraceae bacterium]|jgi:membrane-bound ClpP family serine protease